MNFSIEKKECDPTQYKAKGAACLVWRRFSNLFETLQSLFWAVFGLVSLQDFELAGEKLKPILLKLSIYYKLNNFVQASKSLQDFGPY